MKQLKTIKPRVTLRCVASAYEAPNERIIEFGAGHERTGGLISFRFSDDGTLMVDVYCTTGPILVRLDGKQVG